MFRKGFIFTALLVFSFSVLFSASAIGASSGTALPKATQKMLKDLKLDASLLGDIDKQLAVPQAWIEAAKKEGGGFVRLGTMDPELEKKFIAPFLERYPFVKNYEYNEGGQEDKIKAVEALKGRKATYDTIDGIEGLSNMLKGVKGLLKIDDLPNWSAVPEEVRDPEGYVVGMQTRHWGIGYNTTKVKESDLPKTWEELLTSPIWRNGNLAIGNRPQLWILMLWDARGEAWAKNFITKLFDDVKPQMRKEDMDAMNQLLGAGEWYAHIPAGEYAIQHAKDRGMPVGWYSPEPLTKTGSGLGILSNAKHPYTARIYINWMISREGQICQFYGEGAPPVRSDMQGSAFRSFIPFPDRIIGKKTALRKFDAVMRLQPTVLKYWGEKWLSKGK